MILNKKPYQLLRPYRGYGKGEFLALTDDEVPSLIRHGVVADPLAAVLHGIQEERADVHRRTVLAARDEDQRSYYRALRNVMPEAFR